MREGEAPLVERGLEGRPVDARLAGHDEALLVDLDDPVHAAEIEGDAPVGGEGAALGAGDGGEAG